VKRKEDKSLRGEVGEGRGVGGVGGRAM